MQWPRPTDLPGRAKANAWNASNTRLVPAVRTAAAIADAALIVTSYRGSVLATVHNAIDWLAMRWNHGALHGKPLAVIGSGTLQRDLAVRSVGGEGVRRRRRYMSRRRTSNAKHSSATLRGRDNDRPVSFSILRRR